MTSDIIFSLVGWNRTRSLRALLVGALLALAAWPGSVDAATYVNRVGPGGAIVDVTLGSQTWNAAGSPYIVEARLTVAADATLTIQPGVTVQVDVNRGIYVYGTLLANGTMFTKLGDGGWLGLYLAPSAGASSLDGCTITHAGSGNLGYIRGGDRYTAMFVDACSPTIVNCAIQNSANHGIELWEASPIILNTSFSNLGADRYAIVYDTVNSAPVLDGITFSGTGIAGIYVPPWQTLTGTKTWNNPGGLVYYTHGDLALAEDASWIIEAGTTIKGADTRFLIYGTLRVMGTAGKPVTLTSRNASPAAGDWKGIYLGTGAGTSEFHYAVVSCAGQPHLGYFHGSDRFAALFVDGCNPTFDHLTLDRISYNGMECYAASPTISNSTFSSCGSSALVAQAGSRPVVVNSVFQANGTRQAYTIWTDATSVPTPTNNTFTSNIMQGVQVAGGTIDANAEWRRWAANAPYVVTGNTTVGSGIALTIEPGAVVKFQSSGLYVNGVLMADGSSAPIWFTSWRDDSVGGDSNGDAAVSGPVAGDWKGLYISPNSGDSVLDGCRFRYAGALLGYYRGGDRYTAVFVDSCSPPIRNCRFLDSANNALELWSSHAVVLNNHFNNLGANSYAIIYDTEDTFATLAGNTYSGSGRMGVAIWGGVVRSNRTWDTPGPNFPYLIYGNMTVDTGVTLTIPPTTILKFWNTGMYVYGTLVADAGTQPIVFTSWADDAVGGDSNNDGSETSPAPANWRGIYLAPSAGDSVIQNCTFRYAGSNLGYFRGGDRYAAMYIDNCSPLIAGCRFQDIANHGIELWESRATLLDNAFSNLGQDRYVLVYDTVNTAPVLSGLSLSGTGIPGIYVPPSQTMTGVNVWNEPGGGLCYYTHGDLSVAEGATWQIDPGVVIKGASTKFWIYGTLRALGTPGQPISFTSRNPTPAPGDWYGMYFGPAAGASELRHTKVSYASGGVLGYIRGGDRRAAVFVDASAPVFDNFTLEACAMNGFELYAANPSISATTIKDCGWHALIAQTGSRPLLNTVHFARNGGSGYYTVWTDATSVPVPVATTFEANAFQGVQAAGGTLGADGTWKRWATNAPYVLTGDMTVAQDVTLTLEPGIQVKCSNTGIYVYGTMLADGAAGPIAFTSSLDDTVGGDSNGDGANTVPAPGNWKGIYLAPTAGASVLQNCSFRYGGQRLGYIRGGDRYTLVYVDACSAVIKQCLFKDSSGAGLELFSSRAVVKNNQFADFPPTAYAVVYDTLDCFPDIGGNTASGSGILGIWVPGGNIGSGTWQCPGTDFPYYPGWDLSVVEGATLTIEPGAIVKLADGVYVNGTLQARGTADAPVVFTSRSTTPAPGDWKGIYFAPSSGDSTLRHVTVSYTGKRLGYIRGTDRYTGLFTDAVNPTLENAIVSRGSAAGVTFYGNGGRLTSSLIFANASDGVTLLAGAAPHLVNNTICANGGSGIASNDGAPLVVNNILALNTLDGIAWSSPAAVIQNNCFHANARSNFNGPGDITGINLVADPRFVDPASSDFHVADGSPAINAGDDTVIETMWEDLDGRLRRGGSHVDIGAYEYGAPFATRQLDGLVRNAGDAAYVGQGVFDPALQTKTQTVAAGSTAIYHFKWELTGNVGDILNLKAPAAPSGWTARYFKNLTGTDEITAQITSGTGWFSELMNPGDTVVVRLEVTPSANLVAYENLSVLIQGFLDHAAGSRDALRSVTVNAFRPGVDLLVRRADDFVFAGGGIVNSTGAGQTLGQETAGGETTTFFVELENKGNYTDSFRVQAGAGDANFAVKYFDAVSGGNDITAQMTGAGWLVTDLPYGATASFRVEVTPAAGAPSPLERSLAFTAASTSDLAIADTVKMTVSVVSNASTPQKGTYTLDADFAKGAFLGTRSRSGKLELTEESVTFPFIWVPNSNEGTVSKVDTRDGREIARYRTVPQGTYSAPSRTTVDPFGNCWVCNRGSGTVVKIGLYESGNYDDRNGDGIIQTSQDLDGDGNITGGELLPWGQDECVLIEVMIVAGKEGTYKPGEFTGTYPYYGDNSGARAIASDAQGNVWAGHYADRRYYYINGQTGQILRTVSLEAVDYRPYGAVVDSNGILWTAGGDSVLRLDPADDSLTKIYIGHTVYGLGLSRDSLLYISGWESTRLSRVNVLTGTKDWTVSGVFQSRGVAVTDDGDVWTADSGPGTVTRWSRDGVIKATIAVGNQPTGVAVDAAGKVWVVNLGDEYIHRINPAYNTIDLSKRIIGGNHYGYSDMTGIVSRNATTRFGLWTITHNSRYSHTAWGRVSWTANQPPGTAVKVRARSSEDRVTWSNWQTCTNGVWLKDMPPGKYLQVEVALQILNGIVAPTIDDVTIEPSTGPSGPLVLHISQTGGAIKVAWPLNAGANARLQMNSTLELTGWQNDPATPQSDGESYYRLFNRQDAPRFFRLRSD